VAVVLFGLLAGATGGCGAFVVDDGPLGNGADWGTMTTCFPADANEQMTFVEHLTNWSSSPVVIDSMQLTGVTGIEMVTTKVIEPGPTINGASGAEYPITATSRGADMFAGTRLHDLPAELPPDKPHRVFGWGVLFVVKGSFDGAGATGYDIRYHQGDQKYRLVTQNGFYMHFPATSMCPM